MHFSFFKLLNRRQTWSTDLRKPCLLKKTLNAVYLLYVFKNQPYSEGKKEINQNKISLSVSLGHFFFFFYKTILSFSLYLKHKIINNQVK